MPEGGIRQEILISKQSSKLNVWYLRSLLDCRLLSVISHTFLVCVV